MNQFYAGQTLMWNQEQVTFVGYEQAFLGRLARIQTANGSNIVVSPVTLTAIKKEEFYVSRHSK